jgi:hypothetical protein
LQALVVLTRLLLIAFAFIEFEHEYCDTGPNCLAVPQSHFNLAQYPNRDCYFLALTTIPRPLTTVDFCMSFVKILHVHYIPRHSFSPSDRGCDDTWRIGIRIFRDISNARFPVGTEATPTQDTETIQAGAGLQENIRYRPDSEKTEEKEEVKS